MRARREGVRVRRDATHPQDDSPRDVPRSDLAVVLLRSKSNAYEDLAPLMDEANAKLASIESGTVVRIPSDR